MEKTHPLKEFLGTGLRHLWDLMVLNWMWFLCSLPVMVGVAVYAVCILVFKPITRADCLLLPKGEKIAKLLRL